MKNKEQCYKATDMILAHFKNPETLLWFLTSSVFSIYKYDKMTKEPEDYALFFIYLQDGFLYAWIKNLNRPADVRRENLADKIEDIFKDEYVASMLSAAIYQLCKAMVIDSTELVMDESGAIAWVKNADLFKKVADLYPEWKQAQKAA
jgi:hypothetical protein